MYSKNGSFGQVRLAQGPTAPTTLFSVKLCGWHRCNDQYRIDRTANAAPLFIYTVDGCGEMQIGALQTRLPAGTVAFLPQGATGFYQTPRGKHWEFYWVQPRPHDFLMQLPHPCLATADPAVDYGKRVEQLMRLCRLQGKRSQIELSLHTGELLHLSLLDLIGEEGAPTPAERAARFFDLHLAKPITIQQAAAALFISPAHLCRVFKAEQGCSPHEYLRQARLQYARRLLMMGVPVKQVAGDAGFCSASHFISVFKKEYGITPARYQARRQETYDQI